MKVLFPYKTVRKFQDEMIKAVSMALSREKHLLIHAPTGLGKTVGVLAPAISHSLNDKNTVIFFLTSRHTQHKLAINTIKDIIDKHNLEILAVDFIGKKWLCGISGVHQLSSSEFVEYCKDMREKGACDFYNNLKNGQKLSVRAAQTLKQLKNTPSLHAEELYKISLEKNLCPYEIACLLIKSAKVVVADYYHILNPHIKENLFKKAGLESKKLIIIADEAHNLPERIRKLLTSNLSTFVVDLAIKEAKKEGFEDAIQNLESVKNTLLNLAKETPIKEYERLIKKEEFTDKLKNYEEITATTSFIADQVVLSKKKSFNGIISNFLQQWPGADEGFARVLTKGFIKNKPNIILSYSCLDPSIIIKPLAAQSLIIGMSGTLNPLGMYKDLLGLDATSIEFQSPFPKTNQLNLIVPSTTTKYTERNLQMYQTIAKQCAEITNIVPGNTALFFPSYQMRDEIYKYFADQCTKTTFLEQQGLTKDEKDTLLEDFKKYKKKGAVLLGCSTGSFGEGIDLIGDFLKAVIIIGLPFTKPDLKTKELVKYYNKLFNKGWEYGYMFPAILKCLQNAGRCIRSETDRGVIIFLDQRYTWPIYKSCFPKEWDLVVVNNPTPNIKEFFSNDLASTTENFIYL